MSAPNFAPLSPTAFLERTAAIHPDRVAVVYGGLRVTWAELGRRALRLASALARRGIGRGDTVAAMLPNVPAMLEAHLAVPMLGAVLNAINTRLDARTVGYILGHGEARALLTDREYAPAVGPALAGLARRPLVVDVDDPGYAGPEERVGDLEYEALLAEGTERFAWAPPEDERAPLALNYTSGTTGNPKGVLYHHRGAYLQAFGNIVGVPLAPRAVYLWTLPMFHCNGWCFVWSVTAVGGTHVCLRRVEPRTVFRLIAEEGVTTMCGAPTVLAMLADAPAREVAELTADPRQRFARRVTIATGGASPPVRIILAMQALGFEVVHLYGLTEVFGPSTVCAWQEAWDELAPEAQAARMSRQGVGYPTVGDQCVADPETLVRVPADGATMGELMLRGNTVMLGYLKDAAATAEAFRGGWFHTGDLAVRHPDGYVEIRDRRKDIIISGGENISSIEVELALSRHPAVALAAVVARPDARWGETPCAFVELRAGAGATAEELMAFCRERLPRFAVPRTVVFGTLPMTATGKIQKYELRDRARSL